MNSGRWRGAYPLVVPFAEVLDPTSSTYPLYREDAFALGHLVNGPSLTRFSLQPGRPEYADQYPEYTRHLFVGPERYETFRTFLRSFLEGRKF